jgi:hypothetical protein
MKSVISLVCNVVMGNKDIYYEKIASLAAGINTYTVNWRGGSDYPVSPLCFGGFVQRNKSVISIAV